MAGKFFMVGPPIGTALLYGVLACFAGMHNIEAALLFLLAGLPAAYVCGGCSRGGGRFRLWAAWVDRATGDGRAGRCPGGCRLFAGA